MQIKGLLKKVLFPFLAFFGIFVNTAYAKDYTGKLDTAITLAGGTSETSKAIADCSSYWECTFGYRPPGGGYDFTYSTSGSGDSTLTLDLTLPQNPTSQKTTTPFYINNATINPHSNLILNGFNSILLEYKMGISNASLTFNGNTASNSTIFQMSYKASVVLSDNATLRVVASQFLNQNKVSVSNSTLDITATSIFSYNEIKNDGGTINIKGNFYNVGQKEALGATSPTSTANFISNDGTVVITGNILNGGQLYPNNSCQVGGSYGGICGGGNIIINGGSMSVSGQLISQGSDGQASTIKIYGSTLIVGQGLQNKQGSTITFGVLNGKMGELKGNLTNENGTVLVDKTGASLNTPYKIISGTATGLDSVGLVGNNSQFFSISYENGEVTITDGSDGGGGSKFEQYKNTLNARENALANALSSKFGGDGNLLDSSVNVQSAIADTDKALKEGVISQPKGIINAFKGDTLLAPFGKGFEAKPLAATELIRFDNGRRVKALQAKPSRDFYLAPVGAVLKASDTDGYVAGFTLGTNYNMLNFTNRIYLSYAYGKARQDLATQSTDTKAHLFQVGTMSRYKFDILETDINANFLLADFTINNEWQETALSSTSKFGNYQLSFGLTAGARLGERLSIKPFAGIQNYVELQEGFTSILGFESKSYNAYILDGILGVEGHYKFNDFSSVYGKFSFESRLYNSHKHLFLRAGDNELEYENKGYDNALNVHLGTQILTYGRLKVSAEGLWRHYNTKLDYYGGSLLFKYDFYQNEPQNLKNVKNFKKAKRFK